MDASPRFPVIDLSELNGPRHDQLLEAMVKAAQNEGFFQVVNHGMSVEFLEELKESVHTFFNQPEEKKAPYSIDASPSPVVTYTAEVTSQGKTMAALKMDCAANQEDAVKYWPDSCKEVALKYVNDSSKLAEMILHYLMSHFGMKLDESMVDAFMGWKFVTMNHYPKVCSKDIDVKAAGANQHSDSVVLTVLLQDDVGGLFGMLNEYGDMDDNYKGEWVEIKPIPGALVIIVGDSLQILSNGKYRSCLHYVQTKGGQVRVSVPVFMSPRLTTKIHPLPQVVEKDGGKCRYKEILYEEYYNYAASLEGSYLKPLDSMRISPP